MEQEALKRGQPDGKSGGILQSSIPPIMLAAPPCWTGPDELVEGSGKRRLIAKPRLEGHIDERHGRLTEQLLGVLNALPDQPLVG